MEALTAALVLITFLYVVLTYRIAKSGERSSEIMARQMELLIRPHVQVSVFIPPKRPIFYLKITNTGTTAARNLRLSIDRSFFQYGEKNGTDIATASAFNDPIACFASGAELLFALAQPFVVFGKESDPDVTPEEFSITASYEFGSSIAVTETSRIALKHYLLSDHPPSGLIDELERIRAAVEALRR